MVRPVLEYCDIIYDNAPAYLKISLENVQRKAAIMCTGAYRHTENTLLLKDLSWSTLGERRYKHKLIQFYKIYHNIYPAYLKVLFPQTNAPRYNLRINQEFKLPFYRLTNSANSFFPSTAKVWNNIPPPIKHTDNLATFKRLLFGPTTKKDKFYNSCFGKKGNWLTRLRLGLSALNNHRFTYHLISEPNCTHCVNTPETTEHFLLDCPKYAAPRTSFLNSLADIGVNIVNRTDTINEILHGISFKQNPNVILNPIYIFLTTTNRFK